MCSRLSLTCFPRFNAVVGLLPPSTGVKSFQGGCTADVGLQISVHHIFTSVKVGLRTVSKLHGCLQGFRRVSALSRTANSVFASLCLQRLQAAACNHLKIEQGLLLVSSRQRARAWDGVGGRVHTCPVL
jgi:hypothetical protein